MDRESVIKYLRACLLSSKGGVKIDDLNRDYRMLTDESIPFNKLGFPSLIAFLRTVPDIRTVDIGGNWFIEAQPTNKSAHLAKLVSQQKTTSTKSKKKLGNTRYSAPFRQPAKNKNYSRGGFDYYSQTARRQGTIVPLMELSTKFTINNEQRPRYIQSGHGLPPSSPSKRLKNKQNNSGSPPMNHQSINKPKYDTNLKDNGRVAMPVISATPKTVNNNTNVYKTIAQTNLTGRMNVQPNVPPLNIPNSIPICTSQCKVLSPLSPAQLLAGSNMNQFKPQSPTSPIPLDVPKKNVPKSTQSDSRTELRNRASALNLPEPEYVIKKMKNAKDVAVYASVKLGQHRYASYPQEARSEEDAERIAADIALLDLTEKYGSPSSILTTTNKDVIKERVMAIVDNHPNGVFMHQVPTYYKQQYDEGLPTHWERAIEEYPAIVLEKGVDSSVILRRYVCNDKVRELIPQKTDKIQLSPIGPPAPRQLKLPDDDILIVSVIYVTSTIEIWVRLIDDPCNERFDKMIVEMAHYYSKQQHTITPAAIEAGNYYAIFEDETWHRVRCVNYDSDTGLTTVMFIDHGDEDNVHYSKLHILDKKFCTLPAQAFKVSLFGLEDFSDCNIAVSLIEKHLMDRGFYVEVVSRDVDNNGPTATVVFFDTQGPDDIDLNALLSKQIFEQIVIAPKLDVEGQVSEVFISHTEQNGDIYVQVQSESMKHLVSLLNRLISTGLNEDDLQRSIVRTIDPREIYFVSVEGNWFRGKVVENKSNYLLRVFLIDFGKTVTTAISSLLSLERLCPVLARYPAQVLKVHLHNIDKSMFNEKMAAKLCELAPKGESLLVKVVTSKSGIPIVELFKRIQPSNMLVSINNTLALEDELTRSQGDGNNNVKPRKRIERMNSRTAVIEDDDVVKNLKPPKISGVGEYFDVHVTMAANPSNFVVQPFDDKRSLEVMMIDLQEVCRSYKGPPPTPESVREGKLYAAEHIDGHWYRVCISSIIKENMVTVYFCDFGDLSVLSLNKLQPLKSRFVELPYQAIKAKLIGIQPVNVDWSVEDSLRFQELVVEKNFVSVVVQFGNDSLTPGDTVLGLRLIDVDTPEDIYIDQLLVDEGRAMFIDC